MSDMFTEMYNKQKELYEFLHTKRPEYHDISHDEKLFITSYAMLDEIHELMENVNWKPWKNPKSPDTANDKEELADIMHFWLQYAIERGYTTEELFNTFMNKHEENKNRQVDGGVEGRMDYIARD